VSAALVFLVLAAPWRQGPPMAVAREAHTATVLRDGGVLVAGGRPGSRGALASVELYDDAQSRWLPLASMGVARERHTATLLLDGRVLVTGGIGADSGTLASAELYDPATDTWHDAGTLFGARIGHRATLLPDGRVLLTGGALLIVPLDVVDVFEPPGRWTRVSAMLDGRESHSAALVPGNRVLVAGGRLLTSTSRGSELFDLDAGRWQRGPDMFIDHVNAATAVLPGNEVLIAGGAPAFINDLASSDLWVPGSSAFFILPNSALRYYGSAVVLRDGRALLAGGSDQFGQNPVAGAVMFDPAAKQWRDAGTLLVARTWQAAAPLPGGQALVSGGRVGSEASATTELYDPSLGRSCTSGSQCGTGLCVDGVCCDTACDRPCEACNLPQAPGTCTPVRAGEPGSPSCAPFICAGDAGTCTSACASNAQCAPAGYCTGTTCLPRSPLGTPCDAGDACLRGICADGVCCDSACSGKCDVCDAPGHAGTCTVLPLGAEGSPSCAPYVCSGESNGKCRGTCRDESHCVAGEPCVGGVCGGKAQPPPPPSKACGCSSAAALAPLLALAGLRRRRRRYR